MARSNNEVIKQRTFTSDELHVWFYIGLQALVEATEENALEDQHLKAEAVAQELLTTVASNEVLPEEVHTKAEGLFAIALANLERLSDATYLRSLVSEWFPNSDQLLIRRLQHVQTEYGIGNQTIGRLIQTIEKPEKLKPEKVLESLQIIVRKLKRKPDSEIFKTILDFVVLIWPDLTLEQRREFQNVFTELSIGLSKHDPIGTAELYIVWQDQLNTISQVSDINRPELGLLHSSSTDRLVYSDALRQLLPAHAFDALGYALKHGAKQSATTVEELFHRFDNVLKVIENYPYALIQHMVDVFAEAGYVRRYSNNKFRLTAKGKSAIHLGSSELENEQLATRFLSIQKPKVQSSDVGEQIEATYAIHEAAISIPEKKLVIQGNNRRVLYIGDILFGQKDLKKDTAKELLRWISLLPEDEKPHQVIVSGIVEGGHQFRQKDKRAGNAEKSMDKQFADAKWFFDQLIELGLQVSYVLSTEDIEQARNYTLMAMRALQHWANPQSDSVKGHITYWQEDQIKQIDAYDIHYDFQVNVAYPYYLRSGRRLRSADEIYAKRIVREEYRHLSAAELRQTPGVYVRQEEYLLLFDAYQRLVKNPGKKAEEVLPAHYLDVLEVDNIQLPNKEQTGPLGIYNGLELKSTLVDGETSTEVTALLHHNGLEFSPTTLRKMPLDKLLRLMNQEAATKEDTFSTETLADNESNSIDEMLTFHQKAAVVMGPAVSTPGFETVDIRQKTSYLMIPGSTTMRQVQRGTGVSNPGAIQRKIYNDGRTVTTFLTRRQMELAEQGERTATVYDSDRHTGSSAARPDLFINIADYVINTVLPEYPTVIIDLGDRHQARNVPTMPDDNIIAGLVKIEHQEAFDHRMIRQLYTQGRSMSDLPPQLQNILHVYQVPGNHELNSGPRETKHGYTLGSVEVMASILGENRVTYLQSMVDPQGNLIHHPGGITDRYGGLRQYASHKLLWKKFGGSNFITNAQNMLAGLGSLLNQADILVQGDWHYSMFGLVGNKLAILVPSTCVGSGYEFGNFVYSKPGATIVISGGGLPLEVHEFSDRFLLQHKITSGPFSEEALADGNPLLVTDPGFDPFQHGLYTGRYQKHSAVHKWIFYETDEIQRGNRSRLGTVIGS